MATSTWIKFDGIDGESTQKDHKNEVEVLAWNWGLTSTAGGTSGGGSAGRATPQDLRIVHRYDKASPLLAKKAAQGQTLRSAVLSARRSGQGQRDFLKITLKDVFITAISTSDAGDGPHEEVAMSYASIDVSYTPQTSTGGQAAPVGFAWNMKTNKVS
jgi:type VI secretion system secreted protein Hcp